MKVNGVEAGTDVVFGPVTFRRGPKSFLAFYAKPVWDLDEFNALCPPPVNKNYVFTKAGKEIDNDAPAYKDELRAYHRQRWGYVLMKSLEPSNIEWDNVKADDPKTWSLVESELRGKLAFYEFAKVAQLVDEANALDEDKLAENAKSFLQLAAAGRAADDQNSQA